LLSLFSVARRIFSCILANLLSCEDSKSVAAEVLRDNTISLWRCLLLDRGEHFVSQGGSCCQLFVQPDPEIVLSLAADPAAAASKFPASLLTLLVAPQLSARQLLDDVFDGSLLRLPALQSLSHLAVEV